jgi:hypothetical protein
MGILDERNEFADNVDVSASAGTALVGDVIDLGAAGEDIGNGQPLYLVIRTGSTEIITGGSAGTLQFTLASDAAAAIATNGTATEHVLTEAFVTDGTDANDAEMKAGALIYCAPVPVGTGGNYERYLGILAITATTTTTAGTINAFLTFDPHMAAGKTYPDAVN